MDKTNKELRGEIERLLEEKNVPHIEPNSDGTFTLYVGGKAYSTMGPGGLKELDEAMKKYARNLGEQSDKED